MKPIFLFVGAGEIFSFLLGIAILLFVFFFLRAFFLWYWKVDRIIENQEKQIDLLSKLVAERGAASPPVAYPGSQADIAEKARKYDEMNKQ